MKEPNKTPSAGTIGGDVPRWSWQHHCLSNQQAVAEAQLQGRLRGQMYYMNVQATTGEDGWVETPQTVRNLKEDRERFIL